MLKRLAIFLLKNLILLFLIYFINFILLKRLSIFLLNNPNLLYLIYFIVFIFYYFLPRLQRFIAEFRQSKRKVSHEKLSYFLEDSHGINDAYFEYIDLNSKNSLVDDKLDNQKIDSILFSLYHDMRFAISNDDYESLNFCLSSNMVDNCKLKSFLLNRDGLKYVVDRIDFVNAFVLKTINYGEDVIIVCELVVNEYFYFLKDSERVNIHDGISKYKIFISKNGSSSKYCDYKIVRIEDFNTNQIKLKTKNKVICGNNRVSENLITKFENMFMEFLINYFNNDLSSVKNIINDYVYKKYQFHVNENINSSKEQVFSDFSIDSLRIKDTIFSNVFLKRNTVKLSIVCKYINYFVQDSNIYGNVEKRLHNYYMEITFYDNNYIITELREDI